MKRASCTWRRARLEPLESRRMLADAFEPVPVGEGVGSRPQDFISAANRTYFTADDGIHGREPWVTDGTPAGTRMLIDHTPGSAGSDVLLLAATDSHLIYQVPNEFGGVSAYVTDGAEGQRICDSDYLPIEKLAAASWSKWMAVSTGTELVVTDGTLENTWSEDLAAWELTPRGDRLYFVGAFDFGDPGTIWSTNGIGRPLEVTGSGLQVTELEVVENELLFLTGNRETQESAVWRLLDDATPPTKLADLNAGHWQIIDVDGRIMLQGRRAGKDGFYRIVGGAPTLITELPEPAHVLHGPVHQGSFYFTNHSRYDLWRTDATLAGTQRVADLGAGHFISAIAAQAEGVVFTTRADDGGYSVWSTRGTAETTRVLRSFSAAWDASTELATLGDQVLLTGQDDRGLELWLIDSGVSVHRLSDIRREFTGGVQSDGKRLYTVTTEGSSQSLALWDPTARKATPLASGFEQFGPSNYGNSGSWGAQGQLYVQRTQLSNEATVLWGSRGDPASTVQLLQSSRKIYGHTLVGSRLYFFVYGEGAIPSELWVSDGTPGGTKPVMQLPEYTKLFARGDRLFFAATINGVEGIYTHAGTNQAPTIWHRSSIGPTDLVGVGDSLAYFVQGQADPWHHALWSTDGTAAGTRQVGAVPESPFGQWAKYWTSQNRLFYSSTEGLWVTHGLQQGVRLAEHSVSEQMNFAGGLGFYDSNSQLWATDGTPAGTRLLLDQYVDPADVAVLDNRLYFSAARSGGDYQVWRSDGTTQGTEALSAFLDTEYPQVNFMAVKDQLYFRLHSEDGQTHYQFTPGYGAPRLADLPVTLHGGELSAFVPIGSGEQLRSTAVGALSAVSLTFDEPVVVKQGDLSLSGQRLGPLAIGGFSYDSDRRTATWRLAQPLDAADRITLRLRDAVHDPNGTRLDGEWINPASLGDAFASEYSGDYVEGGDFVFQFTLLPGDANRDNAADGGDYLIWAERFGSQTAAGASAGDFDGDGFVLGSDYLLWAETFGSDLRGASSAPPVDVPGDTAPFSLAALPTRQAREIDWEFLASHAAAAEQHAQALNPRAGRRTASHSPQTSAQPTHPEASWRTSN